MSALTTLGNGSGFIYLVDTDQGSILQNLANTTNTVRQLILAASTSVGLSGRANIYDLSYGKTVFLNASGTAGDLTGAADITRFIVNRGLEATIPVYAFTIASGVLTPIRYASITIVEIETEGAAASDTLDTITTTDYNTGDIIIFRGSNPAQIVTFSDGSGNLLLANNIDFLTAGPESAIGLQYISGTGFVELWRTPGIPISVEDFREGGVAVPTYGVALNTMPTSGTIEFEPGVSANVQVVSGSPALIGSVVYRVDPTPTTAYMDGDQMTINYIATPTGVGANTVTLFGITLTTDQAEGGAVVVTTYYDLGTTTWYSTISPNTEGIDIATTTDLAGYEPDLGNPAANGYVLSSTTAGVRSWVPPEPGQTLAIKVSISSAEILAQNTTPIEIVPAPGAGFIIELIAAFGSNTFNTTAYTYGGSSWIQYSTTVTFNRAAATFQTAFTTAAANYIEGGDIGKNAVMLEDEPLVYTGTADPTLGDGTIDIYAYYRIIAL